jgi:Spy/CpxP family protein refolding chaperone
MTAITKRALWSMACWVSLAASPALIACEDKTTGGDGGAGSGSASALATMASAPPATVSASASASAAPSTASSAKPWGDRRGGTAGMLLRAAHDLDLKDAQKTQLDKIEEPLRSDDEMRNAGKALHTELAAEVKAGKIDMTKITPLYAAIDKAAQTHQAKEADALNALHAMLDSAQRKTLTANVRTKQASRDAAHPPVNTTAPSASASAAPSASAGLAADWNKRRLDGMTKKLDLDAAQQKQVAALLAKGDQPTPAAMETMKADMKKKMDALLAAFEADTFDAKKLDLGMGPAGKKPHDMMDKEVQFHAQLLPILKPDQREKLAAGMDKPRMPMPGMPGMPGGRPDMHGNSPWGDHDHDDD